MRIAVAVQGPCEGHSTARRLAGEKPQELEDGRFGGGKCHEVDPFLPAAAVVFVGSAPAQLTSAVGP